jgi:hypothetical protein
MDPGHNGPHVKEQKKVIVKALKRPQNPMVEKPVKVKESYLSSYKWKGRAFLPCFLLNDLDLDVGLRELKYHSFLFILNLDVFSVKRSLACLFISCYLPENSKKAVLTSKKKQRSNRIFKKTKINFS